MIVDTSAIIALAIREPEAAHFSSLIANSPICRISAGSWIEVVAVLVRAYPHVNKAAIDELVRESRIVIMSVTAEQAEIGEAAYRKYGRGTGHRAKLNFGDCFAYALARATGEPLLFKGDDFNHTDIAAA